MLHREMGLNYSKESVFSSFWNEGIESWFVGGVHMDIYPILFNQMEEFKDNCIIEIQEKFIGPTIYSKDFILLKNVQSCVQLLLWYLPH